MKNDIKTVVSMSRRTDPRWHGEKIIPILQSKYPPRKVHTLAVWTKFPCALINPPWRDVLAIYDQVYVNLTITGLGGTPVEPNVPPPEEALSFIPALIDLVGSPRRIRVRPDPLLSLRKKGLLITNFQEAEKIIRDAFLLGVTTFSTSFMEHYPKVKRRLSKHGYTAMEPTFEKKREIFSRLRHVCQELNVDINPCCVDGFPFTSCIDGFLLSGLHPKGERCRTDKASGQRSACGCTHSVDVGWYSMKCLSGCLYCYAY